MAEREFTFTYDIEYTVKIPWSKTFQITAVSVADAKRQAEAECTDAEDCAYFSDFSHSLPDGSVCESVDVEMSTLRDEEGGGECDSLGIEAGDEETFADEEE